MFLICTPLQNSAKLWSSNVKILISSEFLNLQGGYLGHFGILINPNREIQLIGFRLNWELDIEYFDNSIMIVKPLTIRDKRTFPINVLDIYYTIIPYSVRNNQCGFSCTFLQTRASFHLLFMLLWVARDILP